MFPAGTLGPALLLLLLTAAAAAAAQSDCTRSQGRGHPMPGGTTFTIVFYEVNSISFRSIGLGMLASLVGFRTQQVDCANKERKPEQ